MDFRLLTRLFLESPCIPEGIVIYEKNDCDRNYYQLVFSFRGCRHIANIVRGQQIRWHGHSPCAAVGLSPNQTVGLLERTLGG